MKTTLQNQTIVDAIASKIVDELHNRVRYSHESLRSEIRKFHEDCINEREVFYDDDVGVRWKEREAELPP